MTDHCHEIEEMGALAELKTGDPGLAHVAACPACRSRLAAYRRFMAGRPAHGDAVREQRLADFLAREIGGPTTAAPRPALSPLRRFLNARFVAPGLATAALLMLFFSFQQYRQAMNPSASSVTRSGVIEAPDLGLAVAPTSAGGARFSWQAHPAGDGYRVVVYSAALQELARLEAGSATERDVDPAQWRLWQAAGEPLIWRVEILRGGDLLGASTPSVIPSGS